MGVILKLWYLAFPIGYVVIGLVVGIMVANNGGAHPALSGLLWPIPVIRMLFGGGPLG